MCKESIHSVSSISPIFSESVFIIFYCSQWFWYWLTVVNLSSKILETKFKELNRFIERTTWEFKKIDLIHILLTAIGMVSLPFNHVYSMKKRLFWRENNRFKFFFLLKSKGNMRMEKHFWDQWTIEYLTYYCKFLNHLTLLKYHVSQRKHDFKQGMMRRYPVCNLCDT